jgi:hypothetical protein
VHGSVSTKMPNEVADWQYVTETLHRRAAEFKLSDKSKYKLQQYMLCIVIAM